MVKKIILNFETEELYDDFSGWFSDGGGEDEFYMSREDQKPFISHITFEDGNIKEITFNECDE